MNTLQRIFAAIGFGAIVLSPIAALAQSAGDFGAVHKWTDSVTSKTYVYIPGQTAGSAVSGLTAPKAPSAKNVTLNNCGWGSFTKSTTSPPTNITGANWPATSGTAPTCIKDAAPATTYTTSNDAATGTTIDDGTKIWIRGGTAAGVLPITITSGGTITTKANACGFLKVTVSTSRPMTTFSIGASNYTLADLPSVANPMICRKVGTSSFTYVPAN
jgi:hypothetical protein